MRVASKWVAAVLVALFVLSMLAPLTALAQPTEPTTGQPALKVSDRTVGMIAISVAVVVGSACIAAGLAVARVGSAALGAASERPEILGKSLILVGLAEGIAIYGLIIGIMLLGLIK